MAGKRRLVSIAVLMSGFLAAGAICLFEGGPARAGDSPASPQSQPSKVYVPYEHLRDVLEGQKQGIFMPYDDFQRLWRAAMAAPAGVEEAPVPYLISTARFKGKVGADLASLQMELTVDVLEDGWVEVPIALGEVAVTKTAFTQSPSGDKPLLRVADGQYKLLVHGKGRRVLEVDFVRQLITQPGLNVLTYAMPPAAITTLDLLIPEENMKVDVEPALAATTSQVEMPAGAEPASKPAGSAAATKPASPSTSSGQGPRKATQLQAFLGAAQRVKLSWKPRTQAAEELEPVVIADQVQHIDVAEAVISSEVQINYDIRRRGVDTFTIQLPGDFRIIAVDGANIARWDVAGGEGNSPASRQGAMPLPVLGEGHGRSSEKEATTRGQDALGTQGRDALATGLPVQVVTVKLFAPVKDNYSLNVKMERFLKEAQARVPLTPVVTHEALRTTGVIAITHVARRSVELTGEKNLARVDIGRLPEPLRSRAGATAYRFISADYAGELEIGSVSPRITVEQLWAVGVSADRLDLRGRQAWTVERAGVFEVSMSLPEPWEIVSVGPKDVVDDHQVVGKDGNRRLNILLKREVMGSVVLELAAKADRTAGEREAPVDFILPVPESNNVQTYGGQMVLWLAQQFRAEIEGSARQMQPLPMERAVNWVSLPQEAPAMAMEFQAVDRAKPAGAKFKITLKPPQVSAAVYRLVNIQPGWLEQQAVIRYRILNAPVDTFYVQVPRSMADDVRITGNDIKEMPRVPRPPDADVGQSPVGTEQQAVIRYRILNAPVDTFYVQVPRSMADDVRITGNDIKEMPRVPRPPDADVGQSPVGTETKPSKEETRGQDARDTHGQDAHATGGNAYFKIVLQSPVMGTYDLTLNYRHAFLAGGSTALTAGGSAASTQPTEVLVEPILAAGKISDQSGTIAIAKDDTLAIGAPKTENLIPCDPGSEADLPYAPHRQAAVMAFKYTIAPEAKGPAFELSMPVAVQKEEEVFTRLATAAIIEQVIDRSGTLSTHATYLLSSSRGDRLAISLPAGAKVYSVQINEKDATVEPGTKPDELILRLPPSSGQVTKTVVEVSYGLDNASPRDLRSPELEGGVPVQQTLWRLWAPSEDYLLSYDRTFSPIGKREAEELLFRMSAAEPVAPAFRLPAQGICCDFLRQGSPGKLSVTLVGMEKFDILLWVIVLLAGAVLLKACWFNRLLVVLAAAVAIAVTGLFAPLLAGRLVASGTAPAIVVLVLWLGHSMLACRCRAKKAAPGKETATATTAAVTTVGPDKTAGSIAAAGSAGQPEKGKE